VAAPKAPVLAASGDGSKDVELDESVFAAEIKPHLVHEVVRAELNADRAGTRGAKSRGLVAGGRAKPWRQKGTGRARVGEIRNPLWRKGGTVFGPQPRSYDYALPKKVGRGALRAALAQKVQDGALVVVDQLTAGEIKTKAAAEMLARLGVTGKAVLVDVAADENLSRSVRNIPGVELVQSGRLTARQVADAARVVTTKAALEKLQEALS
jgi:large subunit ribosomal protein L4